MAVSNTLAPSDLEPFRRELTGYCYRMLGSGFEAEDAVQETMLRAWRNAVELRGAIERALLAVPHRHQRVHRHGPPGATPGPTDGDGPGVAARRSPIWGRCCLRWRGSPRCPTAKPRPIARTRPRSPSTASPIRLAFVTALQHLPARQRAVLILCEVLRWQAAEAAELLDTSVAAVNSALQRARATLGLAALRRAPRRSGPGRHRAAPTLCRRLRALRHRGARRADARGRHPVDASVLHVDPGRAPTSESGWSSPDRANAGGPDWWPRAPTAARRSGSTIPIPPAGIDRGHCR